MVARARLAKSESATHAHRASATARLLLAAGCCTLPSLGLFVSSATRSPLHPLTRASRITVVPTASPPSCGPYPAQTS